MTTKSTERILERSLDLSGLSCSSHRDHAAGAPLAHWRSASGFEVDFVLGDHTAVEIKAKRHVSAHDLKSLLAIAEEGLLKRLLCVSLEPRPRRVGSVEIVPCGEFLER